MIYESSKRSSASLPSTSRWVWTITKLQLLVLLHRDLLSQEAQSRALMDGGAGPCSAWLETAATTVSMRLTALTWMQNPVHNRKPALGLEPTELTAVSLRALQNDFSEAKSNFFSPPKSSGFPFGETKKLNVAILNDVIIVQFRTQIKQCIWWGFDINTS